MRSGWICLALFSAGCALHPAPSTSTPTRYLIPESYAAADELCVARDPIIDRKALVCLPIGTVRVMLRGQRQASLSP